MLIICGFISGSLVAREATFSVLLNKGDNVYGKADNFNPLLIGTSIQEGEVVKVVDGGYVALVYESTGASVELTKKGEYKVETLEQDLMNQSTTVMAKYGKFLMEKLNPDDNASQNLNVTGAVERGDEGLIVVSLPKVADVYGSKAYIAWDKMDDIQEYVVSYKNKLDEVITEKLIKGNSFIMDLNDDKLKNEKMIIFNVRAKSNEEFRSPDFGIRRLTVDEKKSIDAEFSSLNKLSRSNNVLDKLLIASFFEKNELIADAITYYNQASTIAGDGDSFNILYDNFMARNGLQR